MYKVSLFVGWPALAVLLSLLWPFYVLAEPQHFQASLEQSAWRVNATKNYCSLSHEIPRFGVARFSQASGKRLQFELDTPQPPVSKQSAKLMSVSPPWKFDGVERQLGYVEMVGNKTVLQMPRDKALRLYYELEQGRMPVLHFDDWSDAKDQVEVRLSPVRFRQMLAKFRACTDQLLYLDFEPLSEYKIYFSTNSTGLKSAARRLLRKIAKEFKGQQAVRIVIGGHADERGSDAYNMKLSKRRADFVARYLSSNGVPMRSIEKRYFGESEPAALQSTQQAWSKNRRVTIWITN